MNLLAHGRTRSGIVRRRSRRLCGVSTPRGVWSLAQAATYGLAEPLSKNAARRVFDINMGSSDIQVSQMFTAWDEGRPQRPSIRPIFRHETGKAGLGERTERSD